MRLNIQRIKAYRTYKRITQKEMAKKMEIAHTSYCHKEKGIKKFTADEVGIMADIFEVNPGDLYSDNSKLG